MAKDREPPTPADYVVTAVSPALIMGLVGSLAFFLLDVLYAGQNTGRLQWTLFFFVCGIVLVSRIAIQIDSGRALGYGLTLAGATFLAMWRFLEYPDGSALAVAGPVFNLVIIAVVWWSANKLTRDCTFVDESVEDAGGGLLDEIREELQSDPPKKARRMGRWVVYFSLAALPLFGLGQSLIPADDDGRRRYAFWLMTVYVASGLGLLLTTTLLGLRRYLRQRRLQMPLAMTGIWVGAGAALIAGFLLVGAFFPRPHSEYPLVNLTPLGSADRNASRFAMRSDSAGKGDGRPGADGKDANAKDGRGGKGQSGGKAAGQSGKPEGSGGDKAGGQSKSDAKSKSGGGEQGKDGQSRDDRADNRRSGDQSKAGDAVRKTNDTDRSRDSEAESSDSRTSTSSNILGTLANILKWIVLIILAIVLSLVGLWFVTRHLAGASDWARRLFESLSAFWRSLFGGAAPERDDVEVEVAVVQERPRPFADFRNPFADGSAAGRSPDELVRYSFGALEAWAFERDLPRRPDETPFEFADRVGTETPALEGDARRLTDLYARLAYARRRLPEGSREQVEVFWQVLDAVASGPPLNMAGRV